VIDERQLAHFLMKGQIAAKEVQASPSVAPAHALFVSQAYDLAALLPEAVKEAFSASEAYKLLFVFERYLRELVVETLSRDGTEDWWQAVPKDVQDDVTKLEETEESKVWMALGSRNKSALVTYPQLLRTIEHCWKSHFEDLLRDRSLLHEARLIAHLRNTISHMSPVSTEEIARIQQTMRDWFRMVAP
jgi:hypothetical protein